MATHQRVEPPDTQSDPRVRVRVTIDIDGSRIDEFKRTGDYIVQLGYLVTNIGHRPPRTGNAAFHLHTSTGRILGQADMDQSNPEKGDGEIAPGKTSADLMGPGGLFTCRWPERVTQVVYDDGHSRFMFPVRVKLPPTRPTGRMAPTARRR